MWRRCVRRGGAVDQAEPRRQPAGGRRLEEQGGDHGERDERGDEARARHAVGDFAQALRAVGEPIFGRTARDVSMSRVLIQLFEITGQFDMHLRPELVLLQKTMMTVEGVARSIWADLDIWAAADPVVRRWMTRELSPAARITRLGEQAGRVLTRLSALAEAPPPAAAPPPRGGRLLPLLLAAAALATALAALWKSAL